MYPLSWTLYYKKKISDWPTIKNTIKDSGKLLGKTGRKPMILPIIMEV